MRIAVFLLATVGMALFMLSPAAANAQGDAIELTELDPPDGAKFDEPPPIVHMCFSEPVNIEDNDTFNFSYVAPNDRNLGLRIVFQPDGECVDVHPGLQSLGDEPPQGTYIFTWDVDAAEGEAEGSGEMEYLVGEGGTPLATETPETTSTPEDGASPTPEDGATADADDDDDQDILLIALITAAAVLGVAILGIVLYALRERLGFRPHAPEQEQERRDEPPPGV